MNNKNKLIDTDNRVVRTREEGVKGRGKWVTGVKYMVTGGNQTSGGEHAKEYTDSES